MLEYFKNNCFLLFPTFIFFISNDDGDDDDNGEDRIKDVHKSADSDFGV